MCLKINFILTQSPHSDKVDVVPYHRRECMETSSYSLCKYTINYPYFNVLSRLIFSGH